MAYLKRQYKVVGIVFIVLSVILLAIMAYFGVQNPFVPIAFYDRRYFFWYLWFPWNEVQLLMPLHVQLTEHHNH
ncbi:MAG: hypothetical protein MZV63_26435 [Marinilabiliales bacterium]|nr:hypothetical protein [Marinilabiliales bacterium]